MAVAGVELRLLQRVAGGIGSLTAAPPEHEERPWPA
jgi:hypothetical protein